MRRLRRIPASVVAWVLTSLVLVVVLLGPILFSPGYLLVGDMVFVPDQPWKASYLGLDGSLPRAVPTDALVWLLTSVLPGAAGQKVLLALPIVVAVAGVQRLLVDTPVAARVAASVVFVWTPYTHDRLAIGQWSLLVSAALLPWVLVAVRTRRWPWLFLVLMGAALFSPSGGLMAGAVAVACSGRRWAAALGLTVIANLPWLVPGLLTTAEPPASRAAVEGFAARAESALGLLPSVLGTGGIWKASIAAPERSQAVIVAGALLVTAFGLVNAARTRTPEVRGLGVVSLCAVLLCLVTAVAPDALVGILEVAPGLGILRDTTRYLAPLALLVALGVGWGVAAIMRRASGWGSSAAVALVALSVAALPSLAWGQLGALSTSEYPAEWDQVRVALENDPLDGPLVVLPWEGSYRRFDWNHARASLDPAPRFFPGSVVIDDRVLLDGATLPNEDARARRVSDLLPDLEGSGVGGVLVERGTPGAPSGPIEGTLMHRGSELELWRLDDGRSSTPSVSRLMVVLSADALVMILAVICFLLLGGRCRYSGPDQG